MHSDPLSTLCLGRLTRLLELNNLEELQVLQDCAYVTQNVELEHNQSLSSIAQNEKKSHNQVKNLFKVLSKRETPKVFGQSITANTVGFVIQLIEYLKIKTDTEGIFRISGNKKRQEELKFEMNRGGRLNLLAEDCPYNSHDIAGILKQFFGELPEPLFTKQLYDCYQQLAEMDSVTAKTKKIETLKFLFLMLPPLNRLLLKELIELLSFVAQDGVNKMSAYNLGVVFAPNIVCTRHPMGSLSDFTDNVEPFTELVSFVIENADKVFQIPEDFLAEAKEYLLKIALDKEKDSDVPMSKSYCQQIDSKEFRREAQESTHEAVMLLYAQVMEMPDGPMKAEFLRKFQESYPGTPMFIPQSIKKEWNKMSVSCEGVNTISRPGTPIMKTKFARDNTSNMSKKSASLPQLSSPEDNFASLDDCTSPVSNKNSSPKSTRHQNSPSTPGQRVKKCLKRIRRRSVELFKPKQSKGTTPTKDASASSSSLSKRAHQFFHSNHLATARPLRSLKKSISTPTLASRRKSSASDDNEIDTVRKLSYGSEAMLDKKSNEVLKNEKLIEPDTYNEQKLKEEQPFYYGSLKKNLSAQYGCVNLAFHDTPDKARADVQKTTTPLIRKALYPDSKGNPSKTDVKKKTYAENQRKREELLHDKRHTIATRDTTTPKIIRVGRNSGSKASRTPLAKDSLLRLPVLQGKNMLRSSTDNLLVDITNTPDTALNRMSLHDHENEVLEAGQSISAHHFN